MTSPPSCRQVVAKHLVAKFDEEQREVGTMSDQFLDVDEEQPVEEVGIESILHQLLDLMATAKSMPLSSSVMVSRDEVTSLLQAALESLPDELRQARWLLREREEFMAERSREAEALWTRCGRRPSTWSSGPRSCARPTRWPSASSTTPTRRRARCATRPRTSSTPSWPAWRSCWTG